MKAADPEVSAATPAQTGDAAEATRTALASSEAMAGYVEGLRHTHALACARSGGARRSQLRLAGRTLRFEFGGDPLNQALTRAFGHLPAATGVPDLTVRGFDGASSGLSLPPPPWSWPEGVNDERLILPMRDASVRVSLSGEAGVVVLYLEATSEAFCWCRDATKLPTYWHGSPLLPLLSWWAEERDLSLVHAAAVGTPEAAVLLVGRGGSGKSTTALLCAEAGLDYLADDYCLVDTTPTVHSVYRSGKLLRHRIATVPWVASLAIDPNADPFQKPVVFLDGAHAHRLPDSRPLAAILVPTVVGAAETRIEPANSAEALRALAPSTLFQLPADRARAFARMAALVRQRPCYRLFLGSDLTGVAPALERFLASVAP